MAHNNTHCESYTIRDNGTHSDLYDWLVENYGEPDKVKSKPDESYMPNEKPILNNKPDWEAV